MLRDVRGKWGKGLAVALAVSGLLLFAGCGNKQAQQKAPAACSGGQDHAGNQEGYTECA